MAEPGEVGGCGVKKEETLGGGPGNPAAEGRWKKLGSGWMLRNNLQSLREGVEGKRQVGQGSGQGVKKRGVLGVMHH